MKIPGVRWWIVALLFSAAVLNYLDRQTLSALAPTIQADLHMDDRAYANVVNVFLVAYTLAYLISGRLADRLGTRTSLALFVVWWSLANILTAAAQSARGLSAFRFLLGLGEAGVWPAASKAVAEWFPARERALAIGFYTMGATVGATFAPYLVIPIATASYAETLPFLHAAFGPSAGWRIAFILTGALGLLWVGPWLALYRQPRQSPFIRPTELRLIEASAPGDPAPALLTPWTWRQVFTSKVTWLLLLGRLITDPVWYFYQFWFPKYLNTERSFSQEQLRITWIVYAAAGIGSIAGGWLSGRVIRRGAAPASSRLYVMFGCACVMPLSPWIATVSNASTALVLTALTIMAALAWLINISSLIVDLVPKHSLGTVFSVVAAGSTLGGIIMNTVVASMVSAASTASGGFLDEAIRHAFGPFLQAVQGQGYGRWFCVMAFLHPLAWLLLWSCGAHRAPSHSALSPRTT